MSAAIHRAALLLTIAVAGGCDYSVWLSHDLDASVELDARVDAMPTDSGPIDAIDASDAHVIGACETTPSILGAVRETDPLEQPTFAVSGRLESLRYGVLVPPSASAITTADTTLLLADRTGTALGSRAIHVEGPSGAPASTATLHALSHESTAEGFLVLGPRALWLLDAAGEGDSIALATPPRPEWQRSAGWVDADRFVFVTDAQVLAVFDRAAGAVTTTSISVAGAGSIHVEPGGVTVAIGGPAGETIVYAPDLSGTEILRTAWSDGPPLGERLLAAFTAPGGRTWILRSPDEFRTAVSSYRVPDTGDPLQSAWVSHSLIAPITATTEGAVVVIQSSGPELTLYSLASDTFTSLVARPSPTLVEWQREDEHVSLLTLVPDATGGLALELYCGAR